MNESDYKKFIEELSVIPIQRVDIEPLEQMLRSENDCALAAINYRRNCLTQKDYNCLGGLLSLGFFCQFDDVLRLACFCISVEASALRHRREIERSCKKYDKRQPLFVRFPSLFDNVRKEELVDYSCIKRLQSSYSFQVKECKGYGILDPRIPKPILSMMDEEYSGKSIYVRVDPYQVSLDKMPDRIQEAVVNYPDPIWWTDLRVYDGKEKGSSYQLLEDPSDSENYWDYLVKGIRRLEFHVERRDGDKNKPYLSMMMEELEFHKNEFVPSGNHIIGRMIHLDTAAKVGDSFNTADLMHIDLAYNYYYDDKMDIRESQDLSKEGKIVDASERTHILRIENIKLIELFPIAFAFFKSQTMVNEWCHYQFMDAKFDVNHRIIE